MLQFADFDWHGAEAEFRRAMALAPNDGFAKYYLAAQLAALGELNEAISLTREALTTEPLDDGSYIALANYLLGLNRLDEAEQANRRAIEIRPTAASYHMQLTVIEIQRGDAQAALEAAQQEPPGIYRDIALAFARQIGNDRGAADGSLRTLIERGGDSPAYQIAEAYALRDDAEATFEWLDRAWSSRDTGLDILLYDPLLSRYRGEPRFAAFCRKIGLPVPGEDDPY